MTAPREPRIRAGEVWAAARAALASEGAGVLVSGKSESKACWVAPLGPRPTLAPAKTDMKWLPDRLLPTVIARLPLVRFRWSRRRGLERVEGDTKRVLGVAPGLLTGGIVPWDSWIAPDDIEAVKESRWKALEQGREGEIVYRILPGDSSGLRRVREIVLPEEPDDTGSAAVEGVLFADASEEAPPEEDAELANLDESSLLRQALRCLRESQERLVRQEKLMAIGELVGGIAHEINNPLTAIIGFCELAMLDCRRAANGASSRLLGQMEKIHGSALRCHRIVKNLLRFSRKYPPTLLQHDLNDSLRATAELLAYEMATHNVKVEMELDPALSRTMVDPHQIEMVLVNLVHNAFYAISKTKQPGTVTLRSRASGDWILITVSDTGPGIPVEHRLRIFDPFFTTKPVGEGTGLGLSLCHGVVAEHGGQIDVESEPGEGATFSIRLPIRAVPREDAVKPRALQPPGGPRANGSGLSPVEKKLRVLIIDDEKGVRDILKRGLDQNGCEVKATDRPEELLSWVREEEPDCILADMWMPGENGTELFSRLTSERPALRDRFVFITGDVVQGPMQEFVEREKLPLLEKPLRIADVVRTLNKFRNRTRG